MFMPGGILGKILANFPAKPDPTAIFAMLMKIANEKLLEFEQQVREMAQEKIEEIKAEIMSRIPTKEELIRRFKNAACSKAAQAAMEKAYNILHGLLSKGDNVIGSIKDKFQSVISKGEAFKERIMKIGNVVKKILTAVVFIVIAILVLEAIILVIPLMWLTGGILNRLVKAVAWMHDMFVVKMMNIAKSIPETLADIGNFAIKLIAIVAAVIVSILAMHELIKFLMQLLEALYLKYLNMCNVVGEDIFPNEDLQTTINPILNDDPDKDKNLTDLYISTLNDLTAGGNFKVIESLKRADFQQIGYKTYKI
tara:strand:- start:52 stop:981 length:930 start_codon:yes stop_codon:yes gene_type:complete